MSRFSIKHLMMFLVVISTLFISVDGQTTGRTKGRNPEKSLFGKQRKVKTKKKKVKEPKAVTKAKRAQEKKQLKLKKDYFNSVDASKKRTYKIQSPEVQSRMKQNQKDIKDREKGTRKKRTSSTKRGARKYKN